VTEPTKTAPAATHVTSIDLPPVINGGELQNAPTTAEKMSPTGEKTVLRIGGGLTKEDDETETAAAASEGSKIAEDAASAVVQPVEKTLSETGVALHEEARHINHVTEVSSQQSSSFQSTSRTEESSTSSVVAATSSEATKVEETAVMSSSKMEVSSTSSKKSFVSTCSSKIESTAFQQESSALTSTMEDFPAMNSKIEALLEESGLSPKMEAFSQGSTHHTEEAAFATHKSSVSSKMEAFSQESAETLITESVQSVVRETNSRKSVMTTSEASSSVMTTKEEAAATMLMSEGDQLTDDVIAGLSPLEGADHRLESTMKLESSSHSTSVVKESVTSSSSFVKSSSTAAAGAVLELEGQLEGGLGQLGGGLGRVEAMLKNGGLEELTLPGSMFYQKVFLKSTVI